MQTSRDDLGVLERGREQLQFLADLADFLEDAVVAFEVMRTGPRRKISRCRCAAGASGKYSMPLAPREMS